MQHIHEIEQLTRAIADDARDGKIGDNTVASAQSLLTIIQAQALDRQLAEEAKTEQDAESALASKEAIGDDAAIDAFMGTVSNSNELHAD